MKLGVWGVTCRVKIDLLDLGKPYTKYIWGDSPLQMEFNAPIRAVKTIIFNNSQVETRTYRSLNCQIDRMC